MWLGIIIAVAVSLALTPLAERLASSLGAVSRPDGRRRLQPRPIPVWGGGAVYIGLLVGIVASGLFDSSGPGDLSQLAALCLSAGIVCLLGCYDDLRDMDARWKLVGQIGAALPLVAAGCWVDRLVVFGYSVELGWLGIPWTIAWLVLGINAFNLIDGMDGLASSIGIAISLVIAWIAGTQAAPGVALPALILAGALAGFLVYNLPPARIYLGDCGSMLTGLVVSWLVLQASLVGPGTGNVTVALVLVLIPLVDTGLAIIRRILMGRSLMEGDRGHVHHRLIDRGFRVWGALALLAGLCFATGLVAWLAVRTGSELLAWAIVGASAVVLVKTRLIGHEEWVLGKRTITQGAASLLAGVISLWPAKYESTGEQSLELATDETAIRRVDEQARVITMSRETTAEEKSPGEVRPAEPLKQAA